MNSIVLCVCPSLEVIPECSVASEPARQTNEKPKSAQNMNTKLLTTAIFSAIMFKFIFAKADNFLELRKVVNRVYEVEF